MAGLQGLDASYVAVPRPLKAAVTASGTEDKDMERPRDTARRDARRYKLKIRALTKSNMLRMVGELDKREGIQIHINDSHAKG
jgi:hypothetical protein